MVNPAVVNKVQKGIDEMDPAWFFRELNNLFPVQARGQAVRYPSPNLAHTAGPHSPLK